MTDKNQPNQGNNPKPDHGVGVGKGQNNDTNYNGSDRGHPSIGKEDKSAPFTITQHFSTPPRPGGNKPTK